MGDQIIEETELQPIKNKRSSSGKNTTDHHAEFIFW